MFQGVSTPVVLVPGAPVLVPELSGAAAVDVAEGVRATTELLVSAAGDATRVTVLGVDPAGRAVGDARASLVRWGAGVVVGRCGAPVAADGDVPDAALIAWWFLDRAGIDLPRRFVPVDGDPPAADAGALLVVVADGPASLTPRAPVPEDPRGVALDADLASWLRDGGALPDPGPVVAAEIGWWSRPAWRVLAGLVGNAPAAGAVSFAPFGVGYHAARWPASSSGGAP